MQLDIIFGVSLTWRMISGLLWYIVNVEFVCVGWCLVSTQLVLVNPCLSCIFFVEYIQIYICICVQVVY